MVAEICEQDLPVVNVAELVNVLTHSLHPFV